MTRRSSPHPALRFSAASTSMGLVALLSVGVAITGCAVTRVAQDSRRAHLARQDLVGTPRAEIESCAGDPQRVEYAGNWQYLTYVSPPPAPETETKRCVATFMVRNGYIEDVDYATPSGGIIGQNITSCLAIVDPCLSKVPE